MYAKAVQGTATADAIKGAQVELAKVYGSSSVAVF
jgi:hypothetical protein